MNLIFKETENCWKRARAKRAAFLVDGETYFKAMHEAMRNARRSIMIAGWDLHSELRLIRDKDTGGYPDRLGAFLNALAKDRKHLQIYLLSWDFSMIYAMEREFFPRYTLKWRTHKRIHFYLDGEHPVGASQHQKVVVIDDAVAFSGGFDLSKWRWDDSRHLPENDRRVDPEGKPYPPFHDVQMAVDGEAAQVLGALIKERWERACGKAPAIRHDVEIEDPWPASVEPELTDVSIAVARTLPAYNGRNGVREVERLYLDSIAAARKCIYIENQYLSAYRIGEALERRLEEQNGPEVVIVLPKITGGWLEQHTMDVLRGRILHRLREADRYDRLRTYWPRVGVDPEVSLMVHAKVIIIDDGFVRVGSSNLSNRSLGLDSECDLAVIAEEGTKEAHAISAFRNRLMAEHLDVPKDAVAREMEAHGSLIKTVESLRGRDRTLVPDAFEVSQEIDQWVPESRLLDPEKPIAPEALFDHFISPDQQLSANRHLLKVILLIAAVLCLAATWRWTPLGEWVDLESAMHAATWVKEQAFAPLLVLVSYGVGGLVSFPVTLMIIATVIIFGPLWGLIYALIGSEISALLLFFLGRKLGRDGVSRFAGDLLNRINQKLSDSGLIAVITFRIIPVAPFSMINLVAGVSKIRLRDFFMGTFIGLLPGTVAIVVLADRISEFLRHPELGSFAALLGAIILVTVALFGIYRWLRRRHAEKKA